TSGSCRTAMRDAAGRSHNNSHASTPVLPGTYHKRRPHSPFAALYLPAQTRPRQRAIKRACGRQGYHDRQMIGEDLT
ncbi:MAG TPA: hypothetical protein VGE05_06210, partial [Novosphingobium sp.]